MGQRDPNPSLVICSRRVADGHAPAVRGRRPYENDVARETLPGLCRIPCHGRPCGGGGHMTGMRPPSYACAPSNRTATHGHAPRACAPTSGSASPVMSFRAEAERPQPRNLPRCGPRRVADGHAPAVRGRWPYENDVAREAVPGLCRIPCHARPCGGGGHMTGPAATPVISPTCPPSYFMNLRR